jgi:membrane-associated phospholipid phosphatase
MRSRIIVIALMALLTGRNEVLAQTGAASPPAQANPNNEAPSTPEHTGWATLARDTAHDFVAFPRRKSTWSLLGTGLAAALATHPADHYVERHVVGNDTAENVFRLGRWVGSAGVEFGGAVGVWAVGRYIVAPATDAPRTNKMSHLGFDLIRAQILSQALVQGVKYSVQRDRPNGDCCAFPSGHAASAFAAAAVLERHLGYRASWPALAAATYVATSRLVDNWHFLSDVMFGASVGMASGWTVVGRHGRSSYALQLYPVRGGAMVALVRVDGE